MNIHTEKCFHILIFFHIVNHPVFADKKAIHRLPRLISKINSGLALGIKCVKFTLGIKCVKFNGDFMKGSAPSITKI